MPYAPTPCLKCGEPSTYRGRCATHQYPQWAGSFRKERLPKDWNTRRLIVLKRDDGICHICKKPGADTVDHLVAGDNHHLDNLAPVHDRTPPHCHRYKTSAEGHAAKRAHWTHTRQARPPHTRPAHHHTPPGAH